MSDEIEIELSIELVRAIEENRGDLSASEFIEAGMKWKMKSKLKLNRGELLKRW